ncbi:uncharacterized protein LOC110988839 isoform X2 [Acanthaster planci]|uniref:Uncharacterized protein LOC110988839 isoform X2 n=1 Tax=Acanthaster planci TaxID=133434 RepID=A0A8B7ZXY4_ACAPL|nr:uncharacterized protein LOC110988839 isoform X2 [Acanthaster planci]
MASTATDVVVKAVEGIKQDAGISLLQRPPLGKQVGQQEKCPCKHQASSAPLTHAAGLGTAQLLFEPTPPSHKKPPRAVSPHVRKIQSAKARLVPSSSSSNVKDDAILPKGGVLDRQRPNSAHVPQRERGNRHRPGSAIGNRPVPKQFLTLETNQQRSIPDSSGKQGAENTKKAVCESEDVEIKRWKERRKDKPEKTERTIPEGIAQLRPWLTEDVPVDWCGVDASSCLIFLPSLCQQLDDLPIVPPIQHSEDVLPHTVIPPPPKPFDPKKLFHYNVEKHIPPEPTYESRSQTRTRRGIYAADGSLLYDEEKYSVNRTEEIIRKEIEDLENLLHGIGNADSSNVMVQYQADISKLQWTVKDTLVKCYQIESHFQKDKPEEQPDLFGLRAYIKEKEAILNQIRARREACMMELERLESEVGMTMQSQVLQAFRRL